MPPKLKVLFITRNLPPLVGGMERLAQRVINGLSRYATVTVIGPHGSSAHLPDNVEVIEVPAGLAGFLAHSLSMANKTTRDRRFDIVLGGSGLSTLAVKHAAGRSRAKSALMVHGLDLVVDSRLYRWLVLPRIRDIDLLIANSANTLAIARRQGLVTRASVVVNPGTDLPDASSLPDARAFRKRHNVPFERFLLFVGRITERKGLSHFLRHSFAPLAARRGDIGLVVVGHQPKESLNQRGEEEEVKNTVQALGLQEHVRFLGKVDEEQLWSAYHHASAQVFPLREVEGDVEGFGMVAIEAAACGTPTVAFETGGVTDAISSSNGHLVTPGDYEAFTAALIDILDSGTPTADDCRTHAERFSWPEHALQMRAALSSLVSPQHVATDGKATP